MHHALRDNVKNPLNMMELYKKEVIDTADKWLESKHNMRQ
jgi:hypothetical protein